MKDFTIIFATPFRADATEVENAHNSVVCSQTIKPLTAMPAQTCVGSYKEDGQEKASVELTFVMPVYRQQVRKLINVFFEDYNQDSVLAVNPQTMQAKLFFQNGESLELGTMQVISEEEAKASECYTFWQGEYWLAK